MNSSLAPLTSYSHVLPRRLSVSWAPLLVSRPCRSLGQVQARCCTQAFPELSLSRPVIVQRFPTFIEEHQYTCWPFPPSMHPVILMASVACDVSVFELPHPGKKGPPRYNCVFVSTDPAADGFLGLDVARVRLFFSIDFCGVTYPCALVWWMSRSSSKPDEDTGMWVVEPDFNADGSTFTFGVYHPPRLYITGSTFDWSLQ